MDPKSFDGLMKQRHSVRYFQQKEIPLNTLKEIMSTALHSPSWCNSQSWSIYIASGKTLQEIKNEWFPKNEQGIKGYADIPPEHRTNTEEKNQNNMNTLFKDVGEFCKDPSLKLLMDSQKILFNAPTIAYLTAPKKRITYSIIDIGIIEMAILLAAKSHGVDSLIAYESIKYPDIIRKYCKVPDNEDIIIGIALGYEDDNIVNEFRAKKYSVDEACHFFN